MNDQVKVIDVRTVAPGELHPLIWSTFDGLGVGKSFLLVNNHDPIPLYYQFHMEMPKRFLWDYLEEGPDEWRIHITKVG